jgi:predicted GNAT family acetyltransferase
MNVNSLPSSSSNSVLTSSSQLLSGLDLHSVHCAASHVLSFDVLADNSCDTTCLCSSHLRVTELENQHKTYDTQALSTITANSQNMPHLDSNWSQELFFKS